MTKKELLDYLCAACDVENAIQACESAISALEARKTAEKDRRITAPAAPQKPKLITIERTISDYDLDKIYPLSWDGWCELEDKARIISGIVGVAVALLLMLIDYEYFGFWGAAIIGLIIFGIGFWLSNPISTHIYKKHEREKQRERWQNKCRRDEQYNAEKKAEHETALKKHQDALLLHQQELNLRDQTVQRFENEIERLRNRVRTLDQLRLQLYSKRILHPNFCNIVAVNQLRDYLDMGIADQLDGNNGLYAQYLLDVRTQRICDSLEDLKRALQRGLSGIASAMYSLSSSVKETKSAINAMETSLTANMSSMQQSLTAAQNATSAQMQSYMDQANSQLNRINNTLSTAAYNQYVTARETSARDYLRRIP